MTIDNIGNVAIVLLCICISLMLANGILHTYYWATNTVHQFNADGSVCVIDYEIMGRDIACYAKEVK